MYIRPKKRLGQNFLVDLNMQRRILESCSFSKDDVVLEIGPGRAEMTVRILDLVKAVYAVELDKELCGLLNKRFKDNPRIQIINKDILKFDLREFFLKNKLGDKKIKVFGNIPYYISSPILGHLFKYKDIIDKIFITTQKEFANRLVASCGSKDWSTLSLFVQYHSSPRVLFNVNKNCFLPVPKVDSSFLDIKIRNRNLLLAEEAELFLLIRRSFGQRRKTLRNNLKGFLSDESMGRFIRENNLRQDVRAEKLSLDNFITLLKYNNI